MYLLRSQGGASSNQLGWLQEHPSRGSHLPPTGRLVCGELTPAQGLYSRAGCKATRAVNSGVATQVHRRCTVCVRCATCNYAPCKGGQLGSPQGARGGHHKGLLRSQLRQPAEVPTRAQRGRQKNLLWSQQGSVPSGGLPTRSQIGFQRGCLQCCQSIQLRGSSQASLPQASRGCLHGACCIFSNKGEHTGFPPGLTGVAKNAPPVQLGRQPTRPSHQGLVSAAKGVPAALPTGDSSWGFIRASSG